MKKYPSPLGDIFLGSIKDGLQTVISDQQASSIILIADENTSRHCVPLLDSVLPIHTCITLPAGEAYKNLDSCRDIWSHLMRVKADRSSLVLNVGGGMICDLGGFAASCYQRGIRFGHIPTSIMAMADASIGGKTGIDYEGYKNYIGHFDVPAFIWIDPNFIKTLPPKETKSGLAEIVKHAIIYSHTLWEKLTGWNEEKEMDWEKIIEENISIKQRIVEADFHEKGLRKILNFGHTLGHAIESHFMESATPLRHGEAITLGMLGESKIAFDMGLLEDEDFQSIINLVHRLLHPVEVTLPSSPLIMHWISGDKKKTRGATGFSLPDKIGSCGWDIKVENELVLTSLEWLSTQVPVIADRLNMEK